MTHALVSLTSTQDYLYAGTTQIFTCSIGVEAFRPLQFLPDTYNGHSVGLIDFTLCRGETDFFHLFGDNRMRSISSMLREAVPLPCIAGIRFSMPTLKQGDVITASIINRSGTDFLMSLHLLGETSCSEHSDCIATPELGVACLLGTKSS